MNYYFSGTWNEIYNISYLWYSSIAVIVGVTVAIIVSLITGKIKMCPKIFVIFNKWLLILISINYWSASWWTHTRCTVALKWSTWLNINVFSTFPRYTVWLLPSKGGTRRKPVDRRLLSPLYLYLSSFAVFQQFSEVCFSIMRN